MTDSGEFVSNLRKSMSNIIVMFIYCISSEIIILQVYICHMFNFLPSVYITFKQSLDTE